MSTDPQGVVAFLQRLFPSFAHMGPEQAQERTEGLGLYAAQTWRAGPEGLRARDIDVPARVHAPLAPFAPKVVQAGRGGTEFLGHIRRGVGDDAHFARIVTGFAKVYAESLQQASDSGPASGRLPPQPVAEPAGVSSAIAATAPGAPGPGWVDGDQLGDRLALDDESEQTPPLLGGPELAISPAAAPPAPAPGGGGLDLAPEPAPAPSSWGGDLDLAPEPAPGPVAAAPQPGPPATIEPPSPSSGGGGLDLLPDEAEGAPEPAAAPSFEELMFGGDAPPAAPAGGGDGDAPAKKGSIRELYEQKHPKQKKPELDAEQAMQAPKDPAERAFWLFERSGNLRLLKEAEAALLIQLRQAPHATAAAMAEAGLAKAALLEGKEEEAKRRAHTAQTRDPTNPLAIEVMVRLERGESQTAPFRRLLAQCADLLGQRDVGSAQPLVDELVAGFGDELPHPHLVQLFVHRIRQDDEGFRQSLSEAWKRYPPRAFGSTPLGGELDADVVDALVHFGRQPFRDDDTAGMKQTYEHLDSKENLIGGSLRMAVALGRVALAGPGTTTRTKRRLYMGIAQALLGLQYYDEAPNWLGRASSIGPTQADMKTISNLRIEAGALRRAFDRPGIKAQLKAYRCLGSQVLTKALQERLEGIRGDRAQREQEMFTNGEKLAEVAGKDPRIRLEIADAAQEATKVNPFAAIEQAEQELKEIQDKRAQAAKGETGKQSKGIFGAIKAAANAAASQVGEARLKLLESQAQGKRQAAIKRLSVMLGKDLSDQEWTQPALKEFARRAAVLDAFMDYYDAEESKAKKEIERLAKS